MKESKRGFSLVELMIAMAIGLLLLAIMSNVYLSSKMASRRLEQLSGLQQSVRLVFDYLATDARMAGYSGCASSTSSSFKPLAAPTFASNFANGVEGYEFANATAGQYTMTSYAPADIGSSSATSWATNTVGTSTTIPIDTISGAGKGLTPGSDVLIVRTSAGLPARLTSSVVGAVSTINMENNASGGKCSDGATDKVSGFCANSYGLIASCSAAQVFQVNAAGTAMTLKGPLAGSNTYPTTTSEVFPMQTIAYYVKSSSSGTTTSLYRRIFDGDHASGSEVEQELVEGVENFQVRYGVDTTTEPDGVIDGNSYVTANSVGDWSRVVAIRVSLLMRTTNQIDGDLATTLPTSAKVDNVTVTLPTTGAKFDRRVFTTTVAVRNKIAYIKP